jgi:hypothetical protein
MTLLEMYLIKLGVIHANQVLLVADGAIWIWQRIPALLKRLGLKPEQIIEVIDFYHAAEKLCEFSQLVFSNDTASSCQAYTISCLIGYSFPSISC